VTGEGEGMCPYPWTLVHQIRLLDRSIDRSINQEPDRGVDSIRLRVCGDGFGRLGAARGCPVLCC
jgi:hypothetical protein